MGGGRLLNVMTVKIALISTARKPAMLETRNKTTSAQSLIFVLQQSIASNNASSS
jgi:hypothetical protein